MTESQTGRQRKRRIIDRKPDRQTKKRTDNGRKPVRQRKRRIIDRKPDRHIEKKTDN